jgi:hypothetical protein
MTYLDIFLIIQKGAKLLYKNYCFCVKKVQTIKSMSTSFSHNFDRFVSLMRMIFLYYLDQESHALMTDLENCLDQEVEKKFRLENSNFLSLLLFHVIFLLKRYGHILRSRMKAKKLRLELAYLKLVFFNI